MTVHDFTVSDNAGNTVSLSDYKGKVLLIVNTATACGLTPQYEALEALYQTYKQQGFEILDFPCNQFLAQAPGTDAEIHAFCTTTYNTTFKRFSKIDVNGEQTHPLYVYLKEGISNEPEDEAYSSFKEKLAGLGQKFLGSEIKWNFTKFLVDRDGHVVARFSPVKKPEDLKAEIENLLKK